MTQETEALKILAEQRAAITIKDDHVIIACNSLKDADAIFEWLCGLCRIGVVP